MGKEHKSEFWANFFSFLGLGGLTFLVIKYQDIILVSWFSILGVIAAGIIIVFIIRVISLLFK